MNMNTAWQTLHSVAVEPLGWMVLHSVWQLACLAAIFAVMCRWLRQSAPQVRYCVAGVALGLMVLLPAATFIVLVPPLEPPVAKIAAAIDEGDARLPETRRLRQPAETMARAENASLRLQTQPPPLEETPAGAAPPQSTLTSWIEPCLPWLVLLWVIGVLVLSMWNLGGWIAVQRMARLGVKPAAPSIERAVNRLRERLKVSRAVRVVESFLVRAPSVIGWLRPVILLPAGLVTGLTPSQLEAVLAHELAHVRRLDYLANLLQTVVETLFFYHPAVHFVSRRMRSEREYCADHLALAVVGDRINYAKTLSEIGERIQASPQFVLAATGGNLADRVRRLFGLSTHDGGRTGSWLIGAAATVAILLGLVGIPTAYAALAQSEAPRITMRRVWADATTDGSGSISPDGRYISYINWTNGNLAVHHLDSGENRELTTEGTWDDPNQWAEYPLWSPDSKQLAYNWIHDVKPAEIRVVSLAGGPPHVVHTAPEGGFAYVNDWAPNGEHLLAYTRSVEGEESMALIRVADGNVQTLENFPVNNWRPRMSPDGRFAVFPRRPPGRDDRDLFLYEFATREVRPLVQHPADDSEPTWGPDGDRLTFLSTRSGALVLWMLRVEDGRPQGEPTPISSPLSGATAMGISPAGEYYFAQKGLGADVFVVDYDPATGQVQGQPRLLTRLFQGANSRPDWSPDGKRLAFLSHRPTPQGEVRPMLIVREEATGRERILLPNAGKLGSPRLHHLAWLPDNETLMVGERVGSPSTGYRVTSHNIETGESSLLAQWQTNSVDAQLLELSPDAQDLYYAAIDKDEIRLIGRSVRRGDERQIAQIHRPGWIQGSAMSPDGRWMALVMKGTITRLDLATGAAKVLTDLDAAQLRFARGMVVSRDGRYLLFAAEDPRRTDSWSLLWRVPSAGGQPEPLGIGLYEIRHLAVHPGGRQLAFTARQSAHATEVWVLESSLLMGETDD